MKFLWLACGAALTLAAAADASKTQATPEPGIYTNEEETYFDDLAKRPTAPWLSINVGSPAYSGLTTFVDAFGKPLILAPALPNIVAKSADRVIVTLQDGTVTELRRARPVTCWVSIRKDTPKPDGSEDWYFQSGVKLHDQGGRAIVGGGDTGVQPVMIRLRNVTWDTGSSNAPVIALYIHKPDNWSHAESYSWAAPDSARVGINLRWVQTGCAVDGAGEPSRLDDKKFKSNEEAKTK